MSDDKTPAATETVIAPQEAPKQEFDWADKRQKVVPLEWPFTFGGVRYEQIVLRRLTQGDVAALIAKINAEKGDDLRFPIFYDDAGNLISDAVWSALDADDATALDEAARDFLPRRFRPEPVAPDTAPSSGGIIDPI